MADGARTGHGSGSRKARYRQKSPGGPATAWRMSVPLPFHDEDSAQTTESRSTRPSHDGQAAADDRGTKEAARPFPDSTARQQALRFS